MDLWSGVSDAFTSLTDDITNKFSSGSGDIIGSVGKTVATSMKANQDKIANSSSSLQQGLLSLGINNNFDAKTENGAPKSVDPEALEAQWYARLNKFASIQSATGGK